MKSATIYINGPEDFKILPDSFTEKTILFITDGEYYINKFPKNAEAEFHGTSKAIMYGKTRAKFFDSSSFCTHEESFAMAYDNSYGFAFGKSKVYFSSEGDLATLEQGSSFVLSGRKISSRGESTIHLLGKVNEVVLYGDSQLYVDTIEKSFIMAYNSNSIFLSAELDHEHKILKTSISNKIINAEIIKIVDKVSFLDLLRKA